MRFVFSAQFSFKNGLGCICAFQTIYQQVKKALDSGQESYVINDFFSSDFNRGLIYKIYTITVALFTSWDL